MKKRIITGFLTIVLVLSLSACDPNRVEPSNSSLPTQNPSTATIQPSQNPAQTQSPKPTETVSPEPDLTDEQKAVLEREQLEAERMELYKEFYVPLRPLGAKQKKPDGDDRRALYLVDSVITVNYGDNDEKDWRMARCEEENVQLYTEYVRALANSDYDTVHRLNYLNGTLSLCEKMIGIVLGSDMNAIVIDIKSGDGIISIPVYSEAVTSVQLSSPRFVDIEGFLEKMKSHGVYTIGRLTTFQDNQLAKYDDYKHAIRNPDGSVWLDDNYAAWVDAYDEWVQDYNIALAKEAALAGFDEINFDYVRFPEGRRWGLYYKEYMKLHDGVRSDEIIEGYLIKAYEELAPYNVNVSADVFGLVSRQWDSDDCIKIGQNWYRIAPYVDYICPMIYPSHYTTGWYNFEYPDKNPYGMVLGAMKDSIEKNAADNNNGKIRLWIQDFTAKYLYSADNIFYYTNEQLYDEVRALRELGEFTFMFWNNGVDYHPERYLFDQDLSGYPVLIQDGDPIGRTPSKVAKDYLAVLSNTSQLNQYLLYVLAPIESREQNYDVWLETDLIDLKNIKILGYTVGSYVITDDYGNSADVTVTLKYTVGDEVTEIYETVIWQTIMENGIWKVMPVFTEGK